MTLEPAPKIIHIATTTDTMYGLDEDGQVWEWQGNMWPRENCRWERLLDQAWPGTAQPARSAA